MSKNRAELQNKIIEVFREMYDMDEPEEDILKVRPNDFDVDPYGFYEDLGFIFLDGGLPNDSSPGGTLSEIIEWFFQRWDGSEIS